MKRRRWVVYWLTATDGALATSSHFTGTGEEVNAFGRDSVATGTGIPHFAGARRAQVTGYAAIPEEDANWEYGSWRITAEESEAAAALALEMTT